MHCLFLNLREQTLLKQLISRALSATTKSADINKQAPEPGQSQSYCAQTRTCLRKRKRLLKKEK